VKFDFKNENGESLSGSLELPNSEPKAYALFAHCFTCSKNLIAANVISKNLTDNNIAVLRFDFTGLGNSQGDFSNSNFSSNVQDLLSAYNALGEQFKHPELLIGHSLGGAAVLKAASLLPDVKAVATIAAPSSATHVSHLFKGELDQIVKDGKAEVNLAGRKFLIKKQLIDDLNENNFLNGVKELKKALLVMHSPIDDIVPIDNASEIFQTARHPKSFVSLDHTDHLLTNKEDAEYVAGVIGAWAKRYLTKIESNIVSIPEGSVLVKSRVKNKFTQDIYSSEHHILADEPISVGGDHLGMNPYELLLSSLGACTSMTIKMYADRKGIQLDEVSVELKHERNYVKDCETCEAKDQKIDVIQKTISIKGNFTPEQEKRLYEIAEKCPVNKTLNSEISIIQKTG
jgi:uncharacterized OsmC-like protein/esterase/lipase